MKGLIFTLLLTYGGAVAAIFSPFRGLLVYICFAIIKPEAMWPWSVPQGNYSRIVALGLLLGWAIQGFGDWRLGRGRIVVFALLAYLGWVMLSGAMAPNLGRSWDFIEAMLKIVLPFLVGVTTVDTPRKLNQLIWVILLSQGYLAYELNLNYFGGYNRLLEEGFAGMDNNSVAIALVTCVGLGFFAGLAAEQWWAKALAFGLMALMVHAILFSFSRGGMLALLITGAVSFFLIPKRLVHYTAFGLAVALALAASGAEVRARFASSFASEENLDASAHSRIELWGDCIDTMVKYPLVGVGPDHWGLVSYQYGWPLGKLAHTLWLQMGAEVGIPGLFFLALFYLSCMVRLWPLTTLDKKRPGLWSASPARMVIASLTGFAISAQFVSLNRLELPFYIALIGAALLKLTSVPARPDPRAAANSRRVAMIVPRPMALAGGIAR